MPCSKKDKRMEKHIEKSEKKRGMSKEEAKKVGWATVNKMKSKK